MKIIAISAGGSLNMYNRIVSVLLSLAVVAALVPAMAAPALAGGCATISYTRYFEWSRAFSVFDKGSATEKATVCWNGTKAYLKAGTVVTASATHSSSKAKTGAISRGAYWDNGTIFGIGQRLHVWANIPFTYSDPLCPSAKGTIYLRMYVNKNGGVTKQASSVSSGCFSNLALK
jgi:hypothetical protein